MSEQSLDLKTALSGKEILFLDDELTTIGNYISRLDNLGIKCELADSLDEAFERIEKKSDDIGLVVIDLFMGSPRSQQLTEYLKEIHTQSTSRNLGRALGQYLWEKRNTRQRLPYCYFTAFPTYYGNKTGEFDNKYVNFVLNKAAILPSRFAGHLEEVLKQWRESFPLSPQNQGASS